ncbi:MAG: phosphatase PAP2 family protein [Bacteroidales bacterium]|nr:phosphatase PAP2 family protein [Bacteroidales bacterium]
MEFHRFTKKNITINTLLVLVYLLWNFVIGEIRSEHYFLVVLWLSAFYVSDTSRRFILAFSIFILFWIIYDSMRILPNYEVSTPHIQEPYAFEKSIFGIHYKGSLLTPNEYFSIVNNQFLDFLSGFFYINWMPIPIGFGVYLYLTDKSLFIKYALVFLFVNLLGFIIYYLYPAAPPWYVALYGFDLHIGVPGNRAGLARFDELVGIPVFENIYNKNANVLAAIPSLHAAYPVVVLFYAAKKKMKLWIKILFTLFMLGIWFSAVYSGHHYIIDVLMGVMLALMTLFLFDRILKNPVADSSIKQFVERI